MSMAIGAVVAFYWANNTDKGIDVLVCESLEDAIDKLSTIMKEFSIGRSDETELDNLVNLVDINHTRLQYLTEHATSIFDQWCEKYNAYGSVFSYTIKTF